MRHSIVSTLKKFFNKLSSTSKPSKHSLLYLNITQFSGVTNDNIFKFVMAFLLIDTLGHSAASTILSATGAIYVLPFLLFSSSAGILADRFSKQKLLVLMKIAEMALMGLAAIAFAAKSVWGCYTLLFLVSTHSALFGPSKYGIIPELVPAAAVSRANGLVTSFTYLAIIVGTFAASFFTEITDRNFVLIAFLCLLIAICGFFSAIAIKQTPAQDSKKRINLFFVREIFQTLQYARSIRHLLTAILGSSFFLMIGAFTQLNIIPFAIQSLNLSEVAGGYLFLATALGIALGAYLAGKASRKRIELGLSCLAGFGMALFFLLTALFSANLYAVIICLVAIGILGGTFIVPFDTFIQLSSSNEKRGQTIAAANFLSFTGVLIASFLLYFFNAVCGLSSASSFAIIGVLTFLISITLSLRLSDLLLFYVARHILYPLTKCAPPNTEAIEKASEVILVLEEATWKNALLLAGALPNIHYLIPSGSKKWRWYHSYCYSLHKVVGENQIKEILHSANSYAQQGMIPCLMLEKKLPQKQRVFINTLLSLFKRPSNQLLYVRPVKDEPSGTTTLRFEK